jgi:hypothetical protein
VLPFPRIQRPAPGAPAGADDAAPAEAQDPAAESEALAALEEVSRRMKDLARALGCPGYFDDENDDRPTAA